MTPFTINECNIYAKIHSSLYSWKNWNAYPVGKPRLYSPGSLISTPRRSAASLAQ